ncbi:PIF1-like helicase [Nitzschia inconspicua]|uniref:ATP-dependent DNA helicase n=1 Tax=Nitzschia inconspicua TaxID=303405 RepID=A0A9K3M0V7_9STRA|nr:PIF1-like helicase [Nitzschia inconspicua]
MQDLMTERMRAGDTEQEQETSSIGLKGMIGAALMATKAHKVAAPMASYLIRNGSRFHFSHDFAYVNIDSFFKEVHEDFDISADENGSVFFKSSVANYLYHPIELEHVCLYDFLAKYSACKPVKKSLDWARSHPSKNHLKIRPLKEERVPVINYLDFLDTKRFEGNNLFTCDIETIPPETRSIMEEHARRCCALFVPFRNVNTDLKSNGCYLERWRKEKQNGKLSAHHEQLLMNVQNCRNSMNGGRPLDMIERLTMKPSKMLHREEIDVEEEEEDDLINEAMDHFLVTGSLEGGYDNDFRDGRGRFQFQSILTRCYGSHKCGTNLVICPNVGPGDRILVTEANETMITEQHEITSIRNERDDRLNVRALNELAIKCVRRIFDKKGHIVDIEVNGTLKNVCDFADIYFCKDVDQKTSFQIIICAFIDQLYKEAEKNTKESVEDEWVNDHPCKSTKRRRCDTLRHQIGKVVNNKQLIGFLSGAGGTGKSHVIKAVCRYAQKLCEELRVKFNKRSIVVTALTGAAAVSINGETTAKAFAFKREVRNELEEFKNAYLVIVDEVSFASVADLQLLDEKMKEILDRPVEPFGGVPIVFSGDFTQLSPVGGVPLYKCDDWVTCKQLINVFMELKVNHRFEKDPGWGKLLERFRDKGPTTDEVAVISSRVVGSHKGPLEKNIPPDAVYATKTNVDRMAINDAIFVKHLEKTHSTDANVQPLVHTLCMKAGNLRFHVRGTRKEYHAMEKKAQDIIYASVGEAHVQDKTKKYHDPLLKLYH